MSERSGLGLLDLEILTACEQVGARSGAPYVKTQRVLEALADSTGIGPRHSYEPLCDMARTWVVHLPLIDFHGNVGSPDYSPADPRYTECRLTALGAGVLAAERGEIGPLPVGLINGTTHAGGTHPPLDPLNVVRAIRAASNSTDDELAAIVGLPSLPTGCSVDGDLLAFASGVATEIHLSAHVVEIGDDRLLISHLPPDSAPSDIANRIEAGAHSIRDVNDSSTPGTGTQIVVTVTPGKLAEARSFIDDIWGVRRTLLVRLPQPLPDLIRSFGEPPTTDLSQRLALIESAAAT